MNAQKLDRWVRRIALLSAQGILAGAAAAGPLQQGEIYPTPEDFPVFHRALTAELPQQDAHFGYTMAAGKVGLLGDTKDDLAVCAPHENEGSAENVSAIYLFLDANLQLAPFPADRLLPKQPYNVVSGDVGIQMGNLKALIGNPRGPGATNLIIAGASTRRVTYPNASHNSVNLAGSVEVFDINASGFNGHAQLSLIAPPDPGPPATAPFEVQGFGHGLALGDVTGDGIDDLAVGAMDTETSWGAFTGNAFGRVYVFKGSSTFLSTPLQSWVGINAPQPQSDPVVDPTKHLGSGFGASLVAVDFDADGKTELVIGRPNRYDRRPYQQGVYKSGSAWIFRGSYLASLLSGATAGSVIDPPRWPYQLGSPPEYQVLLDPFEAQTPDTDWFGWIVYSIGDMGSPNGGPLDGFPDIAIHSEDTDFIGNGQPCQACIDAQAPVGNPPAQYCKVGGLFIFFGVDPAGPLSPQQFVHPEHVLLQPPSNLGAPQDFARFGRSATAIQLRRVWSGHVEGVRPGLLVGSLEKDTTEGTGTGHVMLFRPPFCPDAPLFNCHDPTDPFDAYRPLDVPNGWSGGSLLQPQPPLQANSFIPQVADQQYFGSDIVALDYKGDQFAFPGEQFVVSSRQGKVVQIAADGHTVLATYTFAGSAFSFVPAGTSP